jgi:hypothetical protein
MLELKPVLLLLPLMPLMPSLPKPAAAGWPVSGALTSAGDSTLGAAVVAGAGGGGELLRGFQSKVGIGGGCLD